MVVNLKTAGAWAHYPAPTAWACRRGDRMKMLFAAVHSGGESADERERLRPPSDLNCNCRE